MLDELEHARVRADGLDQLSAAVKAISEKAKISGLLVQKLEVGGPGDFAGCDSTEAIADKILADLVMRFRPVDERDRQGFIELMERHTQEMDEYISAIKARPITAERCDPASTPDWQKLELHVSEIRKQQRRITGNGIQRTVR